MNSVRFYFICMDHFTYNIKYKKASLNYYPLKFYVFKTDSQA